jgi:hypothetical protein
VAEVIELGLHLVEAVEDDERLLTADGPLARAQHRDCLAEDGDLRAERERYAVSKGEAQGPDDPDHLA